MQPKPCESVHIYLSANSRKYRSELAFVRTKGKYRDGGITIAAFNPVAPPFYRHKSSKNAGGNTFATLCP
jgi:hypothetical protein